MPDKNYTTEDRGWVKMKGILDMEMPEKKRNRGFLWLPLLLGMLALGAGVWYYGSNRSTQEAKKPIQQSMANIIAQTLTPEDCQEIDYQSVGKEVIAHSVINKQEPVLSIPVANMSSKSESMTTGSIKTRNTLSRKKQNLSSVGSNTFEKGDSNVNQENQQVPTSNRASVNVLTPSQKTPDLIINAWTSAILLDRLIIYTLVLKSGRIGMNEVMREPKIVLKNKPKIDFLIAAHTGHFINTSSYFGSVALGMRHSFTDKVSLQHTISYYRPINEITLQNSAPVEMSSDLMGQSSAQIPNRGMGSLETVTTVSSFAVYGLSSAVVYRISPQWSGQGGFLLSHTKGNIIETNKSTSSSMVARSEDFNQFSWGLRGGADFHISAHWRLSMMYHWYGKNLIPSDVTGINQSIELGLMYKF